MSWVPVTPAVLDWVIVESGFSYQDIAKAAGLNVCGLKDVIAGEKQLNVTQFNKIHQKIKRPSATFFLPAPPDIQEEEVAYRRGPESADERPPRERIALRHSCQIQDLLIAVFQEKRDNLAPLPRFCCEDDSESAAGEIKHWLGIPQGEHHRHRTPSRMFGALREYLEKHRIFTLLHSLGPEGARGFALPHDIAPVIGISTSVWTPKVRNYTLLHELAHLVTRDSASCGDTSQLTDNHFSDHERWAERFARHFLMPEPLVRQTLTEVANAPLEKKVTRLSNVYHVSQQAAFIGLIEMEEASWSDYKQHYSPNKDQKQGGGAPPSQPRTRSIQRQEMLGTAALELIQTGLREDILSALEVERVLGIPLEELWGFRTR